MLAGQEYPSFQIQVALSMKTGGGHHKRVGGVANLATSASLGYPLSTLEFLTCVVLKSSQIAVGIEGSQQVDW